MKKLLFFAFVLGLTGCTDNKQSKHIETFVCTKDGVTSDLSFKIIRIEEKSSITVTDSMLFYITDILPAKYIWKGDSLQFSYMNEDGAFTDETISKSQIDSEMVFWVNQRAEGEQSLTEANANLKDIESNPKSRSIAYTSFMTDLFKSTIESSEKIVKVSEDKIYGLDQAKRYSQIPPETRLLRAFVCTYSIFNPLLKVKQTQTQTFYFDNKLLKVVCSSGIIK